MTRRVKPAKVYRQIDWDLLALFIGLFVVVAGVEEVGLARHGEHAGGQPPPARIGSEP